MIQDFIDFIDFLIGGVFCILYFVFCFLNYYHFNPYSSRMQSHHPVPLHLSDKVPPYEG